MMESFGYALKGIVQGFKGRNFKIQLGVTMVVLAASIGLKISTIEWLVVLLLIGMVLTAELFNSSIEELANIVRDSNKFGQGATKLVRDLAAGAVLVMALTAAVVGLIIFLPKILMLFR